MLFTQPGYYKAVQCPTLFTVQWRVNYPLSNSQIYHPYKHFKELLEGNSAEAYNLWVISCGQFGLFVASCHLYSCPSTKCVLQQLLPSNQKSCGASNAPMHCAAGLWSIYSLTFYFLVDEKSRRNATIQCCPLTLPDRHSKVISLFAKTTCQHHGQCTVCRKDSWLRTKGHSQGLFLVCQVLHAVDFLLLTRKLFKETLLDQCTFDFFLPAKLYT